MLYPAVLAVCLSLLQTADFSADGMKALNAQKYDEAAALFTKAIAADPADYSARFNLALAQTMLHNDAEAIANYRKVLEMKPGLYEAELNLGILLLREKQPAEAVSPLQAASDQKPKEFRPRLYLAQALLEGGEFAKSEQAYQAAADLDPKSAAAQFGLAQCKAKQNRLDEAAPYFRKAAEMDAGFKDGLLELASLYEKAGRKADAIPLYQQFPDDIGARERLAELLLEAGRAADAIPHLEWAVQKSPTTANRVALALAYRRNKQPDKELVLLQQAVASDPGNADLHMLYGRSLREQKNYAEAARQFFLVTQAKPDSVEAWDSLAGMLHGLGDYTQALAALDRVRALGGETEIDHYLRAIILDKAMDIKGALLSYEKFLAMSQGKHPDEEFKARQRVRILQKEAARR
ncbi:MAG: tetratricopeptide repeat protein [Acidobacteria bacterium]|nr:tetratricopeptide repeat protein [Acidobacteriota bacterium]